MTSTSFSSSLLFDFCSLQEERCIRDSTYTNPEEVIDFATRTGCDSLAISIGTSHGAYKFKPEQCHVDPATCRLVPPPLEFAVLDAVMEKLPGFPIVLHGSSSVPQEEVDTSYLIKGFLFKRKASTNDNNMQGKP